VALKKSNFTFDGLLPLTVWSSITKYVKISRSRKIFQWHIKLRISFLVRRDLHEIWHIVKDCVFSPHIILSVKVMLITAVTTRSEK